ncbi:MAG: DUF3822 family protein [Muribaculaceae bacterium]|nr:DUF3822 family protein [Muribaculaceae bacterium]
MALKDSTQLTTDLISDPSVYRLGLLISSMGVDVLVRSRFNDGTVVYRHIDLASNLSQMNALKEVVYDNPLLTAEFYSTDIVFDTDKFFVVPAALATDEEIERRLTLLWPDERLEATKITLHEGSKHEAVFVGAIDKTMLGFLRRTFIEPSIMVRMGLLTQYLCMNNKVGNMGKIHVRVTPGRTDVIALNQKGLLLVNSYSTECTDDSAYYTLAVARHLNYDETSDRILIGGDRKLRDSLTTALRRFVSLVMPDIMSESISSAVENADALPFELLIAPLCQRTN